MGADLTTCWTLIRGAARGGAAEREHFTRRYADVVRAFFAARWRRVARSQEVEDAVQEVFLECFKRGGVLEKADEERGSFRAFFFSVARHVALRMEREVARKRERGAKATIDLDGLETDEASLGAAFDRAWAKALVREAAALQRTWAEEAGPAAVRRVTLLDLRFKEGLKIRDIAVRWGDDAAHLHHEYAKAREEFRAALREVVAFHLPGTPGEVERECTRLLDLLA